MSWFNVDFDFEGSGWYSVLKYVGISVGVMLINIVFSLFILMLLMSFLGIKVSGFEAFVAWYLIMLYPEFERKMRGSE